MQPGDPPAEADRASGSSGARRGSSWAWPTAWMFTVLVLVGSGVYIFRSCRDLPVETLDRAGKLVEQAGAKAQAVAAAFKQGTITTTFASYATTVSGSQYLQVATLSQRETFTRKDESSMAFGYIPLPDVIVEATAPVSYTYYLDLNAHWEFRLQDGTLWVIAPDLKYNKPAVDASGINYEIKKNSLIRNTSEAMANLKDSITWLSIKKAQTNVELVRDTARRQTETFVQHWLEKAFTDGKNYPVKVVFRTELQKNPDLKLPSKD